MVSAYPSSKLRTRHGMLRVVLISQSPLQHPLFLRATIRFLSFCRLYLQVVQHSCHSCVHSNQTCPARKPLRIKPPHLTSVVTFRCSFVLKAIRHKGCGAFVFSFLFEVFISGISLSSVRDWQIGHSQESFVNQPGPFHHKETRLNLKGLHLLCTDRLIVLGRDMLPLFGEHLYFTNSVRYKRPEGFATSSNPPQNICAVRIKRHTLHW